MYNSTIKRKMCKGGCGKFPKMGYNGYCGKACMPPEMAELPRYNKKPVFLRKESVKSEISRKLHSINNEVLTDDGKKKLQLFEWFNNRMVMCEPVCENCGSRKDIIKQLPELKNQWKSCQAHLLPKRNFISLQSHPLNGMVLGSGYSGMCNCHDDYDAGWERAAKMKIWDEVVRRFLIMFPLITEDEYKYIPVQLLQEINQI